MRDVRFLRDEASDLTWRAAVPPALLVGFGAALIAFSATPNAAPAPQSSGLQTELHSQQTAGTVDQHLETSYDFDWTNDYVSDCVRERHANAPDDTPNIWMNTNSQASYLCTAEQINTYYDPEMLVCASAQETECTPNATYTWARQSCPDVSNITCPNVNTQTIQCFMFAGWGSVSGSCEPCQGVEASGADSACAAGCAGDNGIDPSTGYGWLTGDDAVSACTTNADDGCCDCAPDCGAALNSEYCDCRDGFNTNDDYGSCWNSCYDCFGDQYDALQIIPGTVYMPETLATEACIGQPACYIGTFMNDDSDEMPDWWDSPTWFGSGSWQNCGSTFVDDCSASYTDALTGESTLYGNSALVETDPKAKFMALCG